MKNIIALYKNFSVDGTEIELQKYNPEEKVCADYYYYLDDKFNVVGKIHDRTGDEDYKRQRVGNYFYTEEEAFEMQSLLLEVLKNHTKKINMKLKDACIKEFSK